MQFDRSKLEAVILHTCDVCPPAKLGAVKLHKVLYFLDMIHFAQSGSRLAISGKVLKGLERRREAEAALYEMRWY